jgi:hypothetical protein
MWLWFELGDQQVQPWKQRTSIWSSVSLISLLSSRIFFSVCVPFVLVTPRPRSSAGASRAAPRALWASWLPRSRPPSLSSPWRQDRGAPPPPPARVVSACLMCILAASVAFTTASSRHRSVCPHPSAVGFVEWVPSRAPMMTSKPMWRTSCVIESDLCCSARTKLDTPHVVVLAAISVWFIETYVDQKPNTKAPKHWKCHSA